MSDSGRKEHKFSNICTGCSDNMEKAGSRKLIESELKKDK